MTKRKNAFQRHRATRLRCVFVVSIMILLATKTWGDDVLAIVNDSIPGGPSVTVWVRSLRSTTPGDPWRQLQIAPRKTKSLALASPDSYKVVVEAAGMKFESGPIRFRAKLAEDPTYKLNVVEIMSAPVGQRPQRKYGLNFGDDFIEMKRTR